MTRSPTPARQVTPPEREETAITETAESGTSEEPSAEMDVEAATIPAGQGAAELLGPAPDAREGEVALQGGDGHISTPTRSPQASAGNGPSEGLEPEAGSAPPQAAWTLARGGSSLSGARWNSVIRPFCITILYHNLSLYTLIFRRDRKSTRLNSSHRSLSRMPSSA